MMKRDTAKRGWVAIATALIIEMVFLTDVRAQELLNEAPLVSIVRILAAPELFEGKAVRTSGFLRSDGRRYILFLSEEMAKQSIIESAICLDPSPESEGVFLKEARPLDGSYVRVFGLFSAKKKGPSGEYSGCFDAPSVKRIRSK
jgi:hypothetical protein